MKLHVHSAALRELEQAVTHYEEERPGLGLELLDAVEETVAFAAENPAAGERRDEAVGARRFVVKRFPYLVYVTRIGGAAQVVAIAHASRRPAYWRERLK